jgi:hypothetical protein
MRRAAALFLLMLLAACASPKPAKESNTDFTQTLTVNTPGVSGASCLVQSGAQTWRVTAPGEIAVPRTPRPVNVSCAKGDHMRGAARVTASYAPREARLAERCVSCAYPSTITVAMTLDRSALDAPVVTFGP